MACEFSIPFQQSAKELVNKARESISNAGGVFDGTTEAGTFNLQTPLGAVTGNYTIADGNISIVIGKKPLVVSCGLIRSTLQNYLAQ